MNGPIDVSSPVGLVESTYSFRDVAIADTDLLRWASDKRSVGTVRRPEVLADRIAVDVHPYGTPVYPVESGITGRYRERCRDDCRPLRGL